MKTVLVTAFEPFGGSARNSSLDTLCLLPDEIGGARLVKRVMPVEYVQSGEALVRAAEEIEDLAAIHCLGLDPGQRGPSVPVRADRRRSRRSVCHPPRRAAGGPAHGMRDPGRSVLLGGDVRLQFDPLRRARVGGGARGSRGVRASAALGGNRGGRGENGPRPDPRAEHPHRRGRRDPPGARGGLNKTKTAARHDRTAVFSYPDCCSILHGTP